MTLFHAVIHMDHHTAQIVQFDADHTQAQKIHEHTHNTHSTAAEYAVSTNFSAGYVTRSTV